MRRHDCPCCGTPIRFWGPFTGENAGGVRVSAPFRCEHCQTMLRWMTDRRLPVTVSLLLTAVFLAAIYLGDSLEGNWGFLLGIAVILLAARFVTDAWKTRLVEAA